MKFGYLTPDTRLWIHGRAVRIQAGDASAAVVRYEDGVQETLDLHALFVADALRWESPTDDTATPARGLEDVRAQDLEIARQRAAWIKPISDGGGTAAVQSAASSAGVTARTVWTWIARYRRHGLPGLLPRFTDRGGRGVSRLAADREELLAACIDQHFLTRPPPPLSAAYEEIRAAFAGRQLAPPSMRTFRARVRKLGGARIVAAREGSHRARVLHKVSRGTFPGGSRPLATVLIDHTPLDIHVVDPSDRATVLGRPYLTLAVDACTRMVYGYHVTLDPPSYVATAACILQGVLAHEDLRQAHGLKNEWPLMGLPVAIHTDNGKDFLSQHLVRFAEMYAIELDRRPVRVPEYGGTIEGAIRTINSFTHLLPGSTQSNPRARGDYDSEKYAALTVDELRAALSRRIVDHYHVQPHRGLGGKSPLQVWREHARDFQPRVPSDVQRFRIDLLPGEQRQIGREGVEIHGDLHYSAPELQSLRALEPPGKQRAKYWVKFDPHDLTAVYVVPNDRSTRPIRAELIRPRFSQLSLLEWEAAKKFRSKTRARMSAAELAEYCKRQREIVTNAQAEKTAAVRERRAAARAAARTAAHAKLARTGALAAPEGRRTSPARAGGSPEPTTQSLAIDDTSFDDSWSTQPAERGT